MADRVRLNVDNRFVGIVVVGDRPYRAGKFLGYQCLAILPALRVVIPDTKAPVRSVREVVRRDTHDFFAPEASLRARPKGNLLLRRLRLID